MLTTSIFSCMLNLESFDDIQVIIERCLPSTNWSHVIQLKSKLLSITLMQPSQPLIIDASIIDNKDIFQITYTNTWQINKWMGITTNRINLTILRHIPSKTTSHNGVSSSTTRRIEGTLRKDVCGFLNQNYRICSQLDHASP